MSIRSLLLLSLLGLARACTSDEDCSLNGVCQEQTRHSEHTRSSKSCLCDPGWTGPDCGQLHFRPAVRNTGYNRTGEGISSWGGTIVRDPTSRQRGTPEKGEEIYHLFHAQMAYGCDLSYWIPYSTIVHSISTSGPEGPYTFHKELVGTFAHNPTVIYSPADAEYLLVHIGCSVNVSSTSCQGASFSCGPGGSDSGISAWSSPDLVDWQSYGQVLQGNTQNGSWDADTTNPSIFPLGQGSPSQESLKGMLMAYRGCVESCADGVERIGLASAPAFTGPYTRLSSEGPLFPEETEDPFVWRDKRGNWHMLVHSLESGGGFGKGPNVGRHAYARTWDGQWTYDNNSLAYSTYVEFTDGSATNFSRRERPQLLFSEDGLMRPLFLTTGVQEVNSSLSYTLVQGIDS